MDLGWRRSTGEGSVKAMCEEHLKKKCGLTSERGLCKEVVHSKEEAETVRKRPPWK